MREMGVAGAPDAAGPAAKFDKLAFHDGASCVEALVARFLVTPISAEQRAVLNGLRG